MIAETFVSCVWSSSDDDNDNNSSSSDSDSDDSSSSGDNCDDDNIIDGDTFDLMTDAMEMFSQWMQNQHNCLHVHQGISILQGTSRLQVLLQTLQEH